VFQWIDKGESDYYVKVQVILTFLALLLSVIIPTPISPTLPSLPLVQYVPRSADEYNAQSPPSPEDARRC